MTGSIPLPLGVSRGVEVASESVDAGIQPLEVPGASTRSHDGGDPTRADRLDDPDRREVFTVDERALAPRMGSDGHQTTAR